MSIRRLWLKRKGLGVTDLGSVLIIDDQDIDQLQFARMLKRSGRVQDIHPFGYADDAARWLQEDAPTDAVDLVLLDINMPRMDGYDFLDAVGPLLAERGVCVVVMLTTDLTPANEARLRAHTAVGAFFAKPLKPEHLDRAAELVQARCAQPADTCAPAGAKGVGAETGIPPSP